MKIFLVNLDRRVDRMAFMSRQLKRLGLSYMRLSGVDGALLTKTERRRDVSFFRSYCAMGRALTVGEIGCALSHIAVCRRMVEDDLPFALVLEDDIQIRDEIHAALRRVEDFADSQKPQVFLLSAHGVPTVRPPGIERIAGGLCTDAYVMTLPAARIVLFANHPVVTVADRWTRWAKRYGLEVYRVWPTAVKQDNAAFGSDIWLDAKTKRRAYYLARLLRPLRAVTLAVDHLLFRFIDKRPV